MYKEKFLTYECLIRVLMSQCLKEFGKLPNVGDINDLEDEEFSLNERPIELIEEVLGHLGDIHSR